MTVAPGLEGDVRNPGIRLMDSDAASREVLKLNLTPSQFTERLIHVDGKAFSNDGGFSQRPYLRPIYDGNSQKFLLKSSRQTEKSTTVGNKLLVNSCTKPFFRSLYITPTERQTSRFSADRLSRPLSTSPGLKPFHTRMVLDNILMKEFPNHSTVTLASVYNSPDRIRGVPSDCVTIDEFQDIVSDHIPVIEETMSHSAHKFFWCTGTPKTFDNPIEIYWDRFSTQHEWTVPCHRHDTDHWNILGMKNIGLESLICDKCGEKIYASEGKWQITGDPNAPFRGYHLTQLMVPWVKWSEIVEKLNRYTPYLFYNEVLGLSYDSGTRPLSRQNIIDNCRPDLGMSLVDLVRFKETYKVPLFLGIDWGSGEQSYTVITIIAYHPIFSRLTLLYAKRFIGEDAEPVRQLKIIKKLIDDLAIDRIGTDYGFGAYQNDDLFRTYGIPRVATYMYTAGQRQKVKWDDPLHRFMVNRTAIMSDIFNAIKRAQFTFPAKEVFLDTFGCDYLNVFSEYSEKSRMILYNHPVGRPDDAFHSLVYATLASMLVYQRPDIMDPSSDAGDVE